MIVILLFTEDTIKTILEVARRHLPYIHDKLEEAVILQTKRLKREEGEDAPDIGPVCLFYSFSYCYYTLLLYYYGNQYLFIYIYMYIYVCILCL